MDTGVELTAVAALSGLNRDDFSGFWLAKSKFESYQDTYLGIILASIVICEY